MAGQALDHASLIGQTLGHYRIVEKIGAGGMGEVFRARDEHLDRDAAIKVLLPGTLIDESARKHFHKEALILSQLSHPNVATIYDFDTQQGVDFLVMEYIPGTTLNEMVAAGPLPEKEVLRLGVQLAEGLSAAHEQGVVHRDLKPGNLRLTGDGRLKILDFGLAKLRRPVTDTAATESLSEMQATAGTLPYMAPEQLLGEKVDARTDIHAAGSVLYEMATGRRPFADVESSQLLGAILHRPPRSPTALNPRLSPELKRIIGKCLEKEPENRYQSAKELLVDLRRLTEGVGGFLHEASAVPKPHPKRQMRSKRIRAVAVLPLANFSRDPEQEYFADGMTDALICNLAKLRGVTVTSRTSVMRYKGTAMPLPQIAEALSVDAVVEGSVMRVGQRVRITAQLIRAASDTHLWAETYERDLEDVLLVQSEIARAIAREIQVAVTSEEARRLSGARRVKADAYEAYLKGRFHWYKLSREHLDAAQEYFQLALEKDPSDALAHAGIAAVWRSRGDCGLIPPREALPNAKAAALRAIALDDSLAEAHISLGNHHATMEWNWDEAEKEYKRAIELMPNSADAHFFCSDLLISLRRSDEWKVHIRRANPRTGPAESFFSVFLWLAPALPAPV